MGEDTGFSQAGDTSGAQDCRWGWTPSGGEGSPGGRSTAKVDCEGGGLGAWGLSGGEGGKMPPPGGLEAGPEVWTLFSGQRGHGKVWVALMGCLVPPQSYVEILAPGPSQCGLI